MNEVLKQELTERPPVFVSLGGQEYPLEFPLHAVILYRQATGDNLFDGKCWQKIAPLEDPERFLSCLWAGLQRFDEERKAWVIPFTRDQLEKLVDFVNVTPTCAAVAAALASYFPKAKEAAAGETPLPAPAEASSEPSPSPNSGPSLASTSA